MTTRLQRRRLVALIRFVTAIAIGVLASPGLAAAQVPFEVLHSFTGSPDDGANPVAALIQATDGNFYGATDFGGTTCFVATCGTVFQMAPDGTVTLIHKFNGDDGFSHKSALIQAADENFYGTTSGNTPRPWRGLPDDS